MSDNISVENKGRYIYVKGIRDFNEVVSSMIKLHEDSGICNILIDVRKQDELKGDLKTFEKAELLANNVQGRKLKFAVIFDRELFGDFLFFETVARNRGCCISIFDDEKAAREWLGI